MTEQLPDVDVVVVGCGPVGLTLVHLLARLGLTVVCLEREKLAAQQPRAGHVDAEVLRVWQLAGIADAAAAALSPSPGVEMLNENGELLMRHRVDSTIGPQGWAPDFALHQPTLERVLRERLADLPRAELRAGHTVTAIDQDEDSVVVGYGTDGGTAGTLRSRYVVGCDGASSFVRRAVGSRLESLGPDDPYVVVDAVLRRPDVPLEPGGHLYAWPSRPHYLRVSAPWLRWEFKVLPGEDPENLTDHATVLDLVSRWVRPEDITIERAVSYTFHSLIADRWRVGRVLLAGDAAHQQPPFQGQGLCSGIRDVGNLGWKLAAVLRGDAGAELLDTYQAERAPHARAWIEEATTVGGWVQTLDPVVAKARDAQLLAGDRSRLRPIRPRLGPGLHGDDPEPAGTLAGQPLLADGARLDDVAGERFVVAARPEILGAVAPGTRSVLADEARVLLLGEVADSAAARDALLASVGGPGAVVVRPDRYVLGVADDGAGLDALVARLPAAAHPVGPAFAWSTVTAGSSRLRVATAGAGEPLVYLHGAGGLHLSAGHELLARAFRVVAVELPGFGPAPTGPAPGSMEEIAGRVLDVLDGLGLGRIGLLGTSFGGAVALRLALRSPRQVRWLALEAPAVCRPPEWRPPADLAGALFLHPERRRSGPPPDPAVAGRQIALVARLQAAGDDDLVDRLPGLVVPTLLLRGTADGMLPEDAVHRLAQHLPDVRYLAVADSAHEVSTDQPETYAALVRGFARDVAS